MRRAARILVVSAVLVLCAGALLRPAAFAQEPAPDPTATATATPDPEATPDPAFSPDPEATPDPAFTPDPEATPDPTITPDPQATPDPTDTLQPAAIGPETYGVNAQGVFSLPPDRWDAQLAAIAASGIAVVRRDAFWSDAEPAAPVWGVHTWRWTRHDAIAAALARHGLRWYPVLDYGTPWATTVTGTRAWMQPPDDPSAFAAYAAAFAARYGRGGSFWQEHPDLPQLPVTHYEVWNEENVEQFWPDQSTAPERYAQLLVPTAQAIHAADPGAVVEVGGLSVVGVGDFLARMTAEDPSLWSEVDAVGFHPYGGSPAVTYDRVRTLRAALDAVGAQDEPIEITETGWASPPTPEDTRAAYLRTIASELPRSDCGVTRLLIHTWLTPEADPSNPEDWFGIADQDGSLKPSGAAFADGAAAALAAPEERVNICGTSG